MLSAFIRPVSLRLHLISQHNDSFVFYLVPENVFKHFFYGLFFKESGKIYSELRRILSQGVENSNFETIF